MKLPRNVKILAAASLLNDIATEVVFPLLPLFVVEVLGGTKTFLGVLEGTADSLASLLKLGFGSLSDRTGSRKSFVAVGYALSSVVRPLIALAGAPWQIFAIRLTDRFGKGARTAPRDAMIADSTDSTNRGWAFGFHRAMDHVGAAIGPLLASAFLYFWPTELRTLFLLTVIPGILVVALIFFGLREPPVASPPKERLHLTLSPFGMNFKLFLVALITFNLGNSTDAFLLLRAEELGIPPLYLPLLWSGFHVAKSTSNLILGRAVDRVGAKPLLFAGWLVYALVYLLFALATSAWMMVLGFLFYALYYGLSEPSEKTFVAQLVGSGRKGLAYGWYNFAIGMTMLPASLMFGAIYQRWGAFPAFASGAALSFAAVILMLAVRTPATAESGATT